MSQNDYVMLMGDLNARTAEASAYIMDDNTYYLSLPDWVVRWQFQYSQAIQR